MDCNSHDCLPLRRGDGVSGESCTRWTECNLGQQYVSRLPDALTDRECSRAADCLWGEVTPLLETRDRTCCPDPSSTPVHAQDGPCRQ